MYQIDNSSTVAQMPTPSAAGTPGYFTDGDPATGQAATILPAEFMNAVMMELVNVVDAASITPDKTKTNQVITALNAIFAPQSAFANSKGANGYQKLQGGLILQWGTLTLPSNTVTATSATLTFPIAFPTACCMVLGSPATAANSTSGGRCVISPSGDSTTGCTINGDTNGAYVVNQAQSVFWVAIGY